MSFSFHLVCDVLQNILFATLGKMDYIELGTLHLQLQPGQRSIQHRVTIVNDDRTEVYQETFMLDLHTVQDRVSTLTGLGHAVVIITDDDSKACETYHV